MTEILTKSKEIESKFTEEFKENVLKHMNKSFFKLVIGLSSVIIIVLFSMVYQWMIMFWLGIVAMIIFYILSVWQSVLIHNQIKRWGKK